MSDFITRLAQRQLGQIAAVMPRLPEVFAPQTAPMLPPGVEEIPAAPAAPLQSVSQPTPVTNTMLEPGFVATTAAATPKSASARLAVSPEIAATRDAGHKVIDEPHATFSVASSRPEIAPVLLPSSIPTITTERHSPQRREPTRNYPVSEKTEAPALAASAASDQPPHLITVERRASIIITAPPRIEPQRNNRGGMVMPERSSADGEPPIQVTIGRIEVTAVQQAAPVKRAPAPRKPAMSLDDYLARRQRRES